MFSKAQIRSPASFAGDLSFAKEADRGIKYSNLEIVLFSETSAIINIIITIVEDIRGIGQTP